MNKIEVCLTPELIHQFDLKGTIVVAVDIFRATSCMVSGIAYGVRAIYPVATVEECFALGEKGLVTAGERGGQKVDGFEIGNSPFEYMQEALRDREVAVSTTNGTRTILASVEADEILIGAFLNLDAIVRHIIEQKKDVVVHCAGWKGTVNLEDTLFAGALVESLKGYNRVHGDPAMLAHQLYLANRHDMLSIARASSHAQRLEGFGVITDIEYCLNQSLYQIVPAYKDGVISPIN